MRRLVLAASLLLAACSDPAGAANEPNAPVEVAAHIPDTDYSGGNYAAFADVLARHQRMSARVARVSRRLRVANAPLCDVTRADIGLASHSLGDYPPEIRPLALHFMAIGKEGRFVRSVVPGSPADRARVQPGDRIVSGWPVDGERPLILDGGDGSFPVRVAADRACAVPTFLISADTPNAGTDGREIDLSTALVEQVGDDSALAFIIAHEMAHVLRGHQPDGPRWDMELRADADALLLMRNAGFDVAGTVEGWEAGVEIHRESQQLSATHPPLSIRLKNLQAARDRLAARGAGRLELEPED